MGWLIDIIDYLFLLLQECRLKLQEVEELIDKVNIIKDECAKFYGEDEKSFKLEEIFSIFQRFISNFKKCEEVSQYVIII